MSARKRAQWPGRWAVFVLALTSSTACDGGNRLRAKIANPPNVARLAPAALPQLPAGALLMVPNGCATSAGFAWREPHELVVACGNRVISFDGSFRATSEVEVAGLAVESLSGSSASRRLLVRHGRDWAVLERQTG